MQTNVQIDSKNLGSEKHGRDTYTAEELVASSPSERNWRGIFIALLVIAAVLGLIAFSIFLLSPDIEGDRVKGRRLQLSDIVGEDRLHWRRFNATWLGGCSSGRSGRSGCAAGGVGSGEELVYRDRSGGLTVYDAEVAETRVLMTNLAFRQLNADTYSVSPDQRYVWLRSDLAPTGAARYSIFELSNRNIFPLTHRVRVVQPLAAPLLQHVVWSPCRCRGRTGRRRRMKRAAESSGSGVTTDASFETDASAERSDPEASDSSDDWQAIAFVHENDVYYKAHVQDDVVSRLTSSGEAGLVYNGRPDWLYENTEELKSEALAFAPDGRYLAFMEFNDTAVETYDYAWLGNSRAYPQIRSVHYPKYGAHLPNVTVYVCDVGALHSAQPRRIAVRRIALQPPAGFRMPHAYVGRMQWLRIDRLAVTFLNRTQSAAVTVICDAPRFACTPVHTERVTAGGGVVLANDAILYGEATPGDALDETLSPVRSNTVVQPSAMPDQFTAGAFLIKRLPVALKSEESAQKPHNGQPNGEENTFRHAVLIPCADAAGDPTTSSCIDTGRTVPLTSGPFEVLELLGWDAATGTLYFMATPPRKPGERHLYRVRVRFNRTNGGDGGTHGDQLRVSVTRPLCMTCNNAAQTFQVLRAPRRNGEMTATAWDDTTMLNGTVAMAAGPPTIADGAGLSVGWTENGAESGADDEADSAAGASAAPRNNCQYNSVAFSAGFGHYVQQCLGPDAPAAYLVETRSLHKVRVLDDGVDLLEELSGVAVPQVYTLDVEIRDGFHAQVRLLLPPGLREDEDEQYPLVLHVDAAPGSQLATKRFAVDWNWYLCSQRAMIVAQIDARGSGGQGERLRGQTTGRLGTVDIEDQLAVLTYLRDRLHFIDATRLCAYGWGYGGYAAAMLLAEDSQRVLQCAIAVNPIVSFVHHSTFFADRFMPTAPPTTAGAADPHQHAAQQAQRLQNADLMLRAGNLIDRRFFLVHGTADLHVHEQHALMLARALVAQDVRFRHQVYTDEAHDLAGVRPHLYRTMEWFVDESFGTADAGDWDVGTGLQTPFRH